MTTLSGVSLRAAVCIAAENWLRRNAAGQVVQKFKKPWRSGPTQMVMSPLEFMQVPIE